MIKDCLYKRTYGKYITSDEIKETVDFLHLVATEDKSSIRNSLMWIRVQIRIKSLHIRPYDM
jgi:hypothetical protein